MDFNIGLTQALTEGTNTYTYGLGRISQQSGSTADYFLGDALGSVRQLANQYGELTYAQSYDPYGTVRDTSQLIPDTSTIYGYTGEQQDDSGMVYLRARYYNPADGRFIAKDPSGLESNLYLYTRANPINRIDPSGLYSREMIRKNIDAREFDSKGFFDHQNHSRWGFYALLLLAQDFDYLQVGSLNLQSMHPDVSFSSGQAIWSINCETIMVGSQTLKEYFHNEVKRQRFPSIWWRDTSAMFYDLFSLSTYPNSRRSIADGLNVGTWSDIPQFRGISRGYGRSEVQLIVDINGAFHLSFSGGPAGIGNIWGPSYLEGYLCTWSWSNGCLGNTPSPSDVTATIDGICWSNDLVLIGGVNISPFCMGARLLTEGNYTALTTFSVGAAVGFGTGLSLTLPLSPFGIAPKPTMGWKWALDDQINGMNFSKIFAGTEP